MAAHESAVFRRRHERALLTVTGGDRSAWLQGLVTSDVAAIAGGGASESAWLTPQGRMITDLVVVETGGFTWLDVPAPLAPVLAAQLDLLIFTEDARVQAEPATVSVGVYGPSGAAALAAATGQDPARVEGLAPGQLLVTTDDPPLAICADPSLGVTGWRTYLPAARAAGLEEALAHGGALPLDDQTATVLRVEAGTPRFLVDMTEETIPLEAGLDGALSQTKGCYVGQEIIVRIRDRAHGRVARRLMGLVLPPGMPPPPVQQGVTLEDRPVGRVTSAVSSPAAGRSIALAMLHRDAAEPGTVVTLEDGTPAEVRALRGRGWMGERG
jgi:folate-binding protein YgfZ